MTTPAQADSFNPMAWHREGVLLTVGRARSRPLAAVKGKLKAVAVVMAAGAVTIAAAATMSQSSSSTLKADTSQSFIGLISADLETNISRERVFLGYLAKLAAPDDPLITPNVLQHALDIWAAVKERAPGVRAPTAGANDDGAVVLSWLGREQGVVTTVDVFPSGAIEWFHRDARGKLWGVDLQAPALLNRDVIKRLTSA